MDRTFTGMNGKAKLDISARRKRRSGGHAMMESALTMLPMFALLLAFINFGLTIFKWTTLQNAAREGCRYAITYQRQGSLGQDQSIMNVVQSFSMGMADASLTGAN